MLQNSLRRVLRNASASNFISQCSYAKSPCKENIPPPKGYCPKVAVVLSGCGHLDGSEIHESVAVLSHLTRIKAVPFCFAYNCKQLHVIDHSKAEEDASHCRHIISEASRIARHPVKPLETLVQEFKCYDAVIFPGGFGVAKNFSNFHEKGPDMEVVPEVAEVIKMFHCEKKPIGLICIAPILAAKLIPCVRITLGREDGEDWPFREAIIHAKKMGAVLESKGVNEVCVDTENMVYSTPAFMYNGDYHEVDDGIGHLIKAMIVQLALKEKGVV